MEKHLVSFDVVIQQLVYSTHCEKGKVEPNVVTEGCFDEDLFLVVDILHPVMAAKKRQSSEPVEEDRWFDFETRSLENVYVQECIARDVVALFE